MCAITVGTLLMMIRPTACHDTPNYDFHIALIKRQLCGDDQSEWCVIISVTSKTVFMQAVYVLRSGVTRRTQHFNWNQIIQAWSADKEELLLLINRNECKASGFLTFSQYVKYMWFAIRGTSFYIIKPSECNALTLARIDCFESLQLLKMFIIILKT